MQFLRKETTMKRILSLLITILMIASVLVACNDAPAVTGSTPKATQPNGTQDQQTNESTPAETDPDDLLPPEERLNILAALEGAVLQTYDMIPIMDDASAALKGMQIKYYTEEYIYGVGRGGIKYMQYYYSDAEWDAFVAEQGGTLNYK